MKSVINVSLSIKKKRKKRLFLSACFVLNNQFITCYKNNIL